ncbi:MAG: hypothetical protein JNJ73_07220 [Hyphomonadaceae bacterium]|nr:hypothetical protein [Hyphomonadaceae bacterium]
MADELAAERALRQKTDRVIDNGFDRAQSGLESARSGAHGAVDATEDALEKARGYISRNAKERPLTTAAAAAGVGLLIGLILKR